MKHPRAAAKGPRPTPPHVTARKAARLREKAGRKTNRKAKP